MSTSTRQLYEFGNWRLDPTERTLLLGGEAVALTPKVFDTLLVLVENAGRLVTKDQFMKQVWADSFVEDAALAQNISQLRKAMGDSEVIETVPKKGYRFLESVRTVQTFPASEGGTSHSAIRGGFQESVSVNGGKERRPIRYSLRTAQWRWLGVCAAVAVIAATIYFYLHYSRVSAVTGTPILSLAVLPLQNLSGDPNQEYFADGMTDELITDLAQIHSLRVISRTSVMQFKNAKKSLPQIAAELNVDAVVEGSVLRTGNSVRITAQLLDAKQDRHLWAASYEREIANILDLQAQVARTIADQINVKLTPTEGEALATRRPTNPQSYDALLTGRYLFNRRNAADSLKALSYLLHSAEIDPNNAEAWAALASCYASLGSDLGAADPSEVLPKARVAIAKALELDPHLAQAHTTLAWIKLWYDWDWTGAEQEFRRSLELSPNDSATHREYSHYLQLRKRFDEAIAENKHAIELAPLDILPSIHLAWLYADARDGAKAVEQSKHVLEMDPSFTGAYLMLGRGYELQGKWQDAIGAFEHAKGQYSRGYLAGVAYVWAITGNTSQAQAAMTDLTRFSQHNYVTPVDFATYYAALGERDEAFKWLDRAYRERATGMIALDVNNRLDNLRSDSRFKELERHVGF